MNKKILEKYTNTKKAFKAFTIYQRYKIPTWTWFYSSFYTWVPQRRTKCHSKSPLSKKSKIIINQKKAEIAPAKETTKEKKRIYLHVKPKVHTT